MKANERPVRKKWKRVAAILACVVLTWLAVGLPDAIIAHQRKSERLAVMKALQSLPRDLSESIAEFRDAKLKLGDPIPEEVPLHELVTTGRLKPADIAGLSGHRAFVALSANESTPNRILVRVEQPDGFQTVLVSDGSIMLLPRKP